jgi:hypothetical protein
MRSRVIGLVLLLILSEAIGLGIGHLFFRLFNQTVPPAVLTSFNKGTAYAAFLTYGLGAGLVIFLWSLAAIALARSFGPAQRFTQKLAGRGSN